MKKILTKRLWRIAGSAMIVTGLLGMFGCTGDTQQATTEQEIMICYDYDNFSGATKVFNHSGKLIAQTDGNIYDDYTDDVWIVTDDQGRQTGIVVLKYSYAEGEYDDWGNPKIISTAYRFVDLDGKEVASVTMDDPCELSFLTPKGVNGEIIFFKFIESEQRNGTARYEVYDTEGNCLLSGDLPTVLENWDSNHAYAYYNGEMLIINHEVWSEDWATNELNCYPFAKSADGSFAPKEFTKEYHDIERIYQEGGQATNYWQAMYYPTCGTDEECAKYDILRDDGSIAIEGLDRVYQTGVDKIYARIESEDVLLDMNGKRLYSETVEREQEN